MCTVDEKIRKYVFKSSMMVDMEKCILDDIIWDSESYSSLIRNTPIGELMFAEEIGHYIPLLWKYNLTISLKSYIFESRIMPIEYHWNSKLDDASLLSCYLLKCVTEELHMVIRDTRNDREYGCDDVGCIESSAKSYFDNSIFAPLFTKIEKSKKYALLKIR